jgi:hypothetical protein
MARGGGPLTTELVLETVARGESPAPEVTVGGRSSAPEVVPEVEEETVVVTGAMSSSPVHESTASELATSPGPALGATSSGPQVATTTDAATAIAGEPEVFLGHPLLAAPGEISLDQAVATAR